MDAAYRVRFYQKNTSYYEIKYDSGNTYIRYLNAAGEREVASIRILING